MTTPLFKINIGSFFYARFGYELGPIGQYLQAPDGSPFICLKLYKEKSYDLGIFWVCYAFKFKRFISITIDEQVEELIL